MSPDKSTGVSASPIAEFNVGAMVGRSRWNGVVYGFPFARLRVENQRMVLNMHRAVPIDSSVTIELKGSRFTWMRIAGVSDFPFIRVFLPTRVERVSQALREAGFAV